MSDLFLKLLEELKKFFKSADTVSHNFEAGVCKVKLSVHVATLLTCIRVGTHPLSYLVPCLRYKTHLNSIRSLRPGNNPMALQFYLLLFDEQLSVMSSMELKLRPCRYV